MQIIFISSLHTGESRIMHSKSDNVKIMMGMETDDIIDELFDFFFKKVSRWIRKKNARE